MSEDETSIVGRPLYENAGEDGRRGESTEITGGDTSMVGVDGVPIRMVGVGGESVPTVIIGGAGITMAGTVGASTAITGVTLIVGAAGVGAAT